MRFRNRELCLVGCWIFLAIRLAMCFMKVNSNCTLGGLFGCQNIFNGEITISHIFPPLYNIVQWHTIYKFNFCYLLILHFNITISRICKAAFTISHMTLSSFTLSCFCCLPCWTCTESMNHCLVIFIQNDELSLPPHDMNTHLIWSSPSKNVQLVSYHHTSSVVNILLPPVFFKGMVPSAVAKSAYSLWWGRGFESCGKVIYTTKTIYSYP